ncbi:hypothetical protein Sinac_6177 [Singulisphaera acidiphila DSM 18658]|uniref:HEAT repeat domain-containing protein n=1 Tax=Singulisphaera acidiphila (strain ATCC BAA-1392 / DSM 18658 / VKM B-2454 / MOB10) TaxID=886293 RepID=L0DNL1_SINAD|nr:hypothetical protein Sinac_6177 [Singulisphaera acidiphila DSM 18658]
MIKALAPRMPRGCSWVWPSIVLLGVLPLTLKAQQTTPPTEAEKTAESPSDPPKKEAAAGAATQEAEEDAEEKGSDNTPASVEIFIDPNAIKANANTFTPLPSPAFNPRQARDIESMAKGGAIDRDLIQKYVNKYAADLTNRSFIDGLITPNPSRNPTSAAAVGFREASTSLATPIDLAKRANNTAFLKAYTEALLGVAPKLLKNHLLARLEAAILLGKTGSPDAIDTFIAQLNDKDQTTWVKIWSARGLLNILQGSTGAYQDLPGGTTSTAKSAHALVDWLADKSLPWPAQLRALEALGALRMAADPRAQAKLEMASAAMQLLADPTVRPEVRAQAAWTLGMMRVSQANGKFNYKLVAYYGGEVAAELGERIVATYENNNALAQSYAAPLLYQIYPAFYGVDGARESGLLRMPNLGNNRVFVEQLGNLIKPVAKSAVELFKAPKGNRGKVAKDLSDKVAALKSFLDKNVPEDKEFGDKQFPLKAQIADVRAEDPKVAGAVRGK